MNDKGSAPFLHLPELRARRWDRLLIKTLEASYNEVYVFDASTFQFTLVSQGACRNLGYSQQELCELSPLDLKPNFTLQNFKDLLEPLSDAKTPFVSFQTIHQREDGTTYPVEVRVQLVKEHSPPVYIAIIQDLTEKFSLTGAVRDVQDRYRDLYENAPDLFATVDTKTATILTCNRTFANGLGYSKDEILGRDIFSFYHENCRKEARSIFDSYVRGGVIQNVELQFQKKNGAIIDVILNASTAYDDNGKMLYSRAVWRDVTDLKVVEQRLKYKTDLLQTVQNIQSQFISEDNPKFIFSEILSQIQRLSESEFGFLGVINRNPANQQPYLKVLSYTHVLYLGENGPNENQLDPESDEFMEFHNLDTLFGRVIVTQSPVVSNDPKNDPRSGGLPLGHIPLEAFLGIPIFHSGEMVGMVALANRIGGYDKSIADNLQPVLGACGGIIQRYNAEIALQASNERRRCLVDAIASIVWSANEKMELTASQKSWEEYTGQNWPEPQGRGWLEMFHSESRKRIIKVMEIALQKRQAFEFEAPLWNKDKAEYRFAYFRAIPRLSGNEKIREWVGVINDVHDKVHADKELARYREDLEEQVHLRTRQIEATQKELQTSQRTLFSFINNLKGMVYRLDSEGIVLFVSDGCFELTGYNAADFEKKSFRSFRNLIPLEDRHRVDQEIDFALKHHKPFIIDYRILTSEGNQKWALEQGWGVYDKEGRLEAVEGFVTDCTAERTAQESLRVSEKLFQTLADNAPAGIWRTDRKGDYIYINSFYARNFGLSLGEMKQGGWVRRLAPEERDAVHAKWLRAVKYGLPFREEYRLLDKGGRAFWVYAQATPEKNALGVTTGYVGTVTDITELKLAEQTIKMVNAKLLHNEKLSALGKLTGSIAHEFNNPIYGVLNLLEQTLESDQLRNEPKEFLEIAIKECNRMAELIRKLQNFYKPSAEEKRLTQVNQIIDDILVLTKQQLAERNIRLEKNLLPSLPAIYVVQDQIEQVILNMLQNAMDAISENAAGGVIQISTDFDDAFLDVKIGDNGSGIAPEKMNMIFDPFFSTKSAVKGTGLGLSISHGIIKDHGGEILCESFPGSGTEFTIRIPLYEYGAKQGESN
ncbi:MAG: PAS domain S-box protein [Candidatus Nitrohelix vancouverensis]|uniref:histidine kinase n=1 Tax=Candidatus Nitrohelix vancouverensis TaxID=2705534 RepID=A0A7T0G2X7_9BACT|nr:MAG: PAS domain S-box protein [Candidatus Nitrohelix vancouverensis]